VDAWGTKSFSRIRALDKLAGRDHRIQCRNSTAQTPGGPLLYECVRRANRAFEHCNRRACGKESHSGYGFECRAFRKMIILPANLNG